MHKLLLALTLVVAAFSIAGPASFAEAASDREALSGAVADLGNDEEDDDEDDEEDRA